MPVAMCTNRAREGVQDEMPQARHIESVPRAAVVSRTIAVAGQTPRRASSGASRRAPRLTLLSRRLRARARVATHSPVPHMLQPLLHLVGDIAEYTSHRVSILRATTRFPLGCPIVHNSVCRRLAPPPHSSSANSCTVRAPGRIPKDRGSSRRAQADVDLRSRSQRTHQRLAKNALTH